MGETASEWGFVKLLISLDTALAGILIYGQQHMLKIPGSKWLLALSVALFIASLLLLVRCASILLGADSLRTTQESLRRVNPSYNLPPPEQAHFERLLVEFRKMVSWAATLFWLGALFAFMFFVWNLARA